MKSFKKLFALMALVMVTSVTPLYANNINNLNLQPNQAVTEEGKKANTDNTEGPINGDMFSDMNKVINQVGGMTDKLLDQGDGKLFQDTVSFWSNIVGKAIQLIMGSAAAFYILHTVVDFAFLFSHWLQQLFGVSGKGNNSGGMDGGMSGGNGNKKKFKIQSDDYDTAMSKAGKGGSTSGGMDGGTSGSSNGDASSISKNPFAIYFEVRCKGAIIALCTFIILVTPVGWNLILIIVRIIIGFVVWVSNWLGGISAGWFV